MTLWSVQRERTLSIPAMLLLVVCGACERPVSSVLAVQPSAWIITNTGKKCVAENNIVRAEFAYGGPGTDGMFGGGGARSCGLTFLGYKPTDPSRNIVFRNGSSGGKYDQAVLMELEHPSVNGADHNTPDWTDGNNGVTVVPCTITVNSAGQVVVAMTVKLQTLTLARTTIMNPGGDFTNHFDVTVDTAARYEYAALRTMFAAGTYTFPVGPITYHWGTNFRADGETFACATETGTLYREVVTATANLNTHADYVACMLDDANGNDPDIVWITPDTSISNGTSATVARSICPAGQPYMESALYNPTWAPAGATHADLADFISTWEYPNYGTTACTWPAGLKWRWVAQVSLIPRPAFTADSLHAYWRARVGK
jgi:hypothetical protein